MFTYYLANKFLIFARFCFYYLLYNRYTLFYILLKLRVVYNFNTFVN